MAINIDFDEFYSQHSAAVDKYGAKVKALYSDAINSIAKVSVKVKAKQDKPFVFSDFPVTEKQVDVILEKLASDIEIAVSEGTYQQWLSSNLKNDKIADLVLANTALSSVQLNHYYQRNIEAYDAFQKAKINGLSLSQKIWNYAGQFKEELEMAIDLGLIEGKSAAQLSRDVRGYLNEPEKLFRRVRDSRGNLQLSKHAKAYTPGQGQYRSSFKNAFRFTRTQINMSYLSADWERWQQLDFVIGVRVSLSAAHRIYDICDNLQGVYPKEFKFISWHAQCLCTAIPILMSKEDFERKLAGESAGVHYIKDMPDGFTNWIDDNAEKVSGWKHTPYFIRDNFKDGKISGGLKF